MTKRIPNGVTVYEMPIAQQSMVLLAKFSIHQGDMRIPMYFTTEKQLDFDILRRAVETEIERNDALRIVCLKKGGKLHEYFAPSMPTPEIPFRDFTNGTNDELYAWLKEDAAKPLPYLKGQTYRIKFFRTPDGKCGVYALFSHACMDLYGILTFFGDLAYVYEALKNGTELPRPLARYEDVVRRQLDIEHNRSSISEELEFFAEYFKKDGPSFYAGIDGMKQLNATRKRKKDPNARYIDLELSDPFNDKSTTLCCHIGRDLTDRMNEFCNENSISLQNLFYIAMRTYLSKINEYTDDVNFHFLINRRATLNEKRCGGSCASLLPLRTVIEKDKTFSEALGIAKNTAANIMRHVNIPPLELLTLPDKVEHRRMGATSASMMFTVCPANAFTMPDGWNCDLGGISTGYFPFIAYTVVLPSPCDGGLNCWYEYRPHRFTEKNFKDLHEGALKVIEAGLANPDITIGDILNNVL